MIFRIVFTFLFLGIGTAHAERPDPVVLSHGLDNLYRAQSSKGKVEMTVVTPHYQRTLKMSMITRGLSDTLIRILSPRKERGISTLKKGTEMWNYLPKIKKTIRVPPSMMMGSWMGSDFTNDDLVRASSWENDYTVTYSESPSTELCLTYSPKPQAAVTWSKVVVCFDAESKLPLRQEFYDEKNRKARTMTLSEIKEMGGRKIPSLIVLTPHLKKGHTTKIRYLEMGFDVELPPNTFSQTNLRRAR